MKRYIWILWTCLVLVYLYRFYTFPQDDQVLKSHVSNSNYFYVEIMHEPDSKKFGIQFVGKIRSTCWSGNCKNINSKSYVQVQLAENSLKNTGVKSEDVEIGDVLYIQGSIAPVFQDDKSGIQSGLKNYFLKQKIFYKVKVKSVERIERGGFSFTRSLIQFRKSIEGSLATFIRSPESDLAQGLVVSGKGSLSKDILEQFKRVGLIHIVVLSGSNVSIISQALFKFLSVFPQIFKTGFGILGMTSFALMTGSAPPVVRSVLMSSLPLLYEQIYKTRQMSISTLHVLCLVAMSMSIYNPLFPIHDPSFQLSFLATFGLILLSKPVAEKMSFLPNTFQLREIVSSSIATQIYITPLLLHMSGGLSTIFLIANIVVLPLLPFIMLLLFLVAFSGFIFPIIGALFGQVSYFVLHMIMAFTSWLSHFSWAFVEYDQFGDGKLSISYGALFLGTLAYLSYTHLVKNSGENKNRLTPIDVKLR